MDYNILMISLISLFILAVIIFYVYKNRENKNYRRIWIYLLLLGLVIFVFLFISLLWFFNIVDYFHNDFIIIFSFLVLIKTIILYLLFYSFLKTKKIFLLLFVYLSLLIIPIFSSFFIKTTFSLLLISISFLLMLLIFIKFYLIDSLKDLGKIGIIYSSLSLIFHFSLFVSPSQIILFFLFSEILFLLFLIKLFGKMEDKKYYFSHTSYKTKSSYLIDLLRHFIFILVFVGIIFVAVSSIHELGHMSVSKFYGCDYQRIIYEQGILYTEILCSELFGNVMVILGGFLLPVIISILLFLGGGKLIKEVAILILGFNLIISYKDFIELGISKNVAIFSSIIGCLLVLIGIGLFSKSRAEDI